MFFKRKGYPDQSELILCRVIKVLPHAVFVQLEEFENLEGLIHISEIAPGRIRNIRDFVKEDKRVVCKVLSLNKERGHIDLSLRRVGNGLRIKKLHEIKQDEKAENLLSLIGKQLNKDLAGVYALFGNAAVSSFGRLTPFFEAVVSEGKGVLSSVGLSGKDLDSVYLTILEKIKPQSVTLSGSLLLSSFAADGITQIRSVLVTACEKFGCRITYISAPKYKWELIASDYREAEERFEQIIAFISAAFPSVEFVRDAR